ncbi:unnamed protein product [Vicia faba]|uniref:Uncharacterized protein n=1 Tax=Vicia faba TaxID=3906 RepID=A0AAV1B0W5_VICFA|nr:unnamed protein product [Vicia faba]
MTMFWFFRILDADNELIKLSANYCGTNNDLFHSQLSRRRFQNVRYCIDITLKVLEIAYALGLNVSVVVAHEVSVTNFVSGVSPTKIYITEGVRIYFYKIYVLCHLTLQLLSYLSKIPTVRLIVVVGDIDD